MKYCSLATVLAVTAFIGCNSDTCPVSGTITFEDGSPVNGARVIFRSKIDGEFISAFATTDENGEYSLTTWQTDDGAVPGEHTVIVIKPRQVRESPGGMTELLPMEISEKHADYGTSQLKFTVNKEGNLINIELERFWP